MIRKLLVVGLVIAALGSQKADASLVFTLNEVGADVVLSGSGTVNLAGMSFLATFGIGGEVEPDQFFTTGGPAAVLADFYSVGITGPSNFGPGIVPTTATSGTGDLIGFQFIGIPGIIVPAGYLNGPLTGTATFTGATINGLGAADGTYIWNLANGDTVTLIVESAAVPEPSSFLLLVAGGIAMAIARRRR